MIRSWSDQRAGFARHVVWGFPRQEFLHQFIASPPVVGARIVSFLGWPQGYAGLQPGGALRAFGSFYHASPVVSAAGGASIMAFQSWPGVPHQLTAANIVRAYGAFYRSGPSGAAPPATAGRYRGMLVNVGKLMNR